MAEAIEHRSDVPLCPDPIFVIGAPRSGTTGFARALARHTALWTSAETLFLYSLFKEERLEEDYERWYGRPHASWLRAEEVSREEFLGYVGLGINALLTSRSGGRRWVDHTPHHALIAETLVAMFPGAYFLHIVRDGRSAVHSMVHVAENLEADVEKQMRSGQFLPPWTRDFKQACRTWRDSVAAAGALCAKHPERCLTVRHERLTSDPEQEFRGILEFIGVPFEEKPAAFWQSTPVNSSFEDASARGKTGLDRWASWTPEERRVFREIAGPVLTEQGMATEEELQLEPDADAPHLSRSRP